MVARATVLNPLLEVGTYLKASSEMNSNELTETCHDLRARWFKFYDRDPFKLHFK
jgi:hypothetical protein